MAGDDEQMKLIGRFLYGAYLRGLIPFPDCGFSTAEGADMRLYCNRSPDAQYDDVLFEGELIFKIAGGNGYALIGEYPGRLAYSGPSEVVIDLERKLLHNLTTNSVTRWFD